jgi:hypothetical protein
MRNKQNIIEHNRVKPMYTTTVLSKEQFKEFYTFLNIIKPHFGDLCIVNGQFRSRSNCLTCIVEAYFEYFNSIDFIIGDIKMFVKMLSALSKKTKITVVVDDENVHFSDGYQSVKISRGVPENCDNAFVTEDELNNLILEVIDSNKRLVKQTLPAALVYRLNRMAVDIGANRIKFKHLESDLTKGCIVVSSSGIGDGHERKYEIELKNNLLTTMDKGHFFNFFCLPYIFNKSDMNLDFSFSVDPNVLIIIHNTKVEALSINIYGRAPYLNENE